MSEPFTPEKLFSLMKTTARLIRLNKQQNETLAQLVRAVGMKGRTGTIDEMDHLIESFEYATGIKDRYEPRQHRASTFLPRHRWPTHFRDSDCMPVRITESGAVYGFFPRARIGSLDDEPKVCYTSIKEMRGEDDEGALL